MDICAICQDIWFLWQLDQGIGILTCHGQWRTRTVVFK